MKIEKISEHGIRAFLSDEDEKQLCADDKDILYDRIRDVIIGAAKAQFGFAYAKDDCEMSRQSCCTLTVKKEKRKKQEKNKKHTAVLCFDDKDALSVACAVLSEESLLSSSLFRGGAAGTYYLLIEFEAEKDGDALKDRFLSLFELCSAYHVDKKAVLYRLSEHCDAIFEKNAVEHIANSDKTW